MNVGIIKIDNIIEQIILYIIFFLFIIILLLWIILKITTIINKLEITTDNISAYLLIL